MIKKFLPDKQDFVHCYKNGISHILENKKFISVLAIEF